jgi:hypothetical protein
MDITFDKERRELEDEFQRIEFQLAQLFAQNKYVYTDDRYPKLYPEATRLERRQDQIIEILESHGIRYK